MASKLSPSLAAAAFAALLFHFFLKRRSREINRGEANNDAAANEGTAGGASGAHTSTESHEMANSSGDDFEVFLSFRGPDTRPTFTDHLYTRLKDVGIRVFKDDEDLRKGEEFAPELLQAIKQSKILVPIFSKDYVSSVWCLKEIVQMVECKKTGGQKIVPIFYDVAPAEVRFQTGGYKKAFRSHENKKRHDQKTIGEWKAALSAVGEINGWDLHNEGENRREGEFVKKFMREVFNELKTASLVVSDYLVDVDNHADAIMGLIGAQTNETRVVGIHGMGGIGKTTTAKIIYSQLSENFEGCCFLSNIREMSEKSKGIECLQNQLISDILRDKSTDVRNIDDGIKIIKDRLSNKRVLLLLDDLYEKKHMDELVGERDWFGKGSKLIITTRNKETLVALGVDDYYELTGMDHGQSLKLFSKHAFKRDSPLDEYINQSNRAIDIAGGLPLALEVIGSLLYCTKKEMWDARLKMLESVPHDKIQSTLKISYDALKPRQKDTFLDIACLFIGYDKDILVHFWDEPDFFPEVAMEDLQNMSLIKINEDNKVWMHDLLRDFGREMVRQESDKKIVKQSRVWDPKVGSDLLRKHKGKKEVQALRLKLGHEPQCRFTYEGFENLSDLRFLEVDGRRENFHAEERLLWHESPSNVLPTNENSDLLPYLRWLSWSDFPPTFNIANFFVEDLVILNLSQSEITHDWKGWSHMKVMKNLKVLNLSNCTYLQKLPDSIGNLKSLIELDISDAWIEELPDSIGKLKNLKRLKMGRIDISKIPDALWTIEKLEEIEFSRRPEFYRRSDYVFKYLHVNIGNCINKNQSLRILRLVNADIHAPPRLPESLVTLELKLLYMDTFPDLSYLTNLKELDLVFHSPESHEESDGPLEEYPIPRWMGNLSKLESLNLTSHFVTTSPTDLTLSPHLKSFYLDCPKLESLCLCSPCVTASPTDLTLPPHLSLHLSNCRNLRRLPRLPSSLSSLLLSCCDSLCSMEDLDLSSPQLKELHLYHCPKLLRLPRLPSSLSSLLLKHCHSLCSMEDLDLSYPQLKELHLYHCPNLLRLPRLPSSLSSLLLEHCDSLCSMEDLDLSSPQPKELHLPRLPSSLSSLHLSYCNSLCLMEDLDLSYPQLKELHLYHCPNLRRLPRLPSSLSSLLLEYCDSLCSMEDLDLSSPQLKELHLYHCPKLLRLPRLPSSLSSLLLDHCDSLCSMEDLDLSSPQPKELHLPRLPSSLSSLHLSYCNSLCSMEDLDLSSPQLKELRLYHCPNLRRLPTLPSSLSSLLLSYCNSLCSMEDMDLSSPQLKVLRLIYCPKLLRLLRLPSSLSSLCLEQCDSLCSMEDLDLSSPQLKELHLYRCPKLLRLPRLPSSLSSLRLEQCDSLCSMEDLDLSSPQLKELHLYRCPKLLRLPRLPSSLSSLYWSYCHSLCSMEDLSNLKNLSSLHICSAAIEEIQGLGCLENLRDLKLFILEQVKILPDLSNLNKLRSLLLSGCDNVVEIQGELPESLEELEIDSCESLWKLPDLSSLNGLRSVTIKRCTKLNVEAISSLCLEKSVVFEGEDRMGQRRCRIWESEGEDDEHEYESEGEDDEYEYESEGEDDG